MNDIEATEPHAVDLSGAGARELTDQIKTGMESVWHLIRAAYRGRAWSALGYGSWDEYVTREFGNLYLRPPLEDRREVVQSLREAGMSTRAIVSATRLSKGTVQRELSTQSAPGAPNGAPANEAPVITGVDGKTYQPVQTRAGSLVAVAAAPKDQSDLDTVLDMPAEDFGIQPLDLSRRDEEQKGRARRVLTAFNGSGAAAVPALIKAATPVASLVSPATGKGLVEDEDLHGVVWASHAPVEQHAGVEQGGPALAGPGH